jgi:hypothetical protein
MMSAPDQSQATSDRMSVAEVIENLKAAEANLAEALQQARGPQDA